MINNILLNSVLIIIIVILVNYLIYDSIQNFNDWKPFECGFENIYWTHPKFRVHFFKVGVIFVLFDLELIILILSFLKYIILIWIIIMFIFLRLWIEFKAFRISWTL